MQANSAKLNAQEAFARLKGEGALGLAISIKHRAIPRLYDVGERPVLLSTFGNRKSVSTNALVKV